LDIYGFGFVSIVIATLFFNLLAILSIRGLHIAAEEGLRR
jgi:hypothetical protein